MLLGISSGYLLVQMSSLPVALSLPTLAEDFNVDVDEAAWIVIVYLLTLGSTVLLAARMGDDFGHIRLFFVGTIASTLVALLSVFAGSLGELVAYRALGGFGAALITGNSNAILAATFPIGQRGRAFAVPIIGSRFGTMFGLASFGLSLQFTTWRVAFLSFVPIGVIAILAALPMVLHEVRTKKERLGGIDILGSILLIATASVLVLSGAHLHSGEESFTSSDALTYHLPMHGLFLFLLVAFILVELRVKHPLVDLRHFREKYFSLGLISNVAFHFSMLAAMTLMPILVEEGFEMAPIFVMVVLIPNQTLGLFIPLGAGWLYDRYGPKLLRPGAMSTIAGGFLILGLLAGQVPFWALPLMMVPISLGTSVFNPVNNAAIMSALPLEHRGVSSGMLETTRELGHAFGATASATALAVVLPAAIDHLPELESQAAYVDGFEFAALTVVFVLLAGAVVAYFYKSAIRSPVPSADTPLTQDVAS